MTSHLNDYTDEERRHFAALPKSSDLDPRLEDRIVDQLRDEGLLRKPARRFTAAFTALAAALVLAAWFGGMRYGASAARASSIEGLLARNDLSAAERTLLMQRAGSAYVAAANGYAASVRRADSTAIEVSNQVLMGAAQAVARTNLDGALATKIAVMIRDARTSASAPKIQPVIWY